MGLCQEVKAELGLGLKNPSMRTHFPNASASLERIRICIGIFYIHSIFVCLMQGIIIRNYRHK